MKKVLFVFLALLAQQQAAQAQSPAPKGCTIIISGDSVEIQNPDDMLNTRVFVARSKRTQLLGYMDNTGKWRCEPQYEWLEGNNLFFVVGDNPSKISVAKKSGKYGFLRGGNEEFTPFVYENAEVHSHSPYVFCVKQSGKWGILNGDNPQKQIAAPVYDSLIYDFGNHSPRIDAYFFAQRQGKWGIIDLSANVLLPLQYDKLDKINDTLLRACQADSCFLINRKGERLCPCAYEIVPTRTPNQKPPFSYKEGKNYGLIDEQCRPITSAIFLKTLYFPSTGDAHAQDAKTKRYGVINTKGEWLIAPKFKDFGLFEPEYKGKKALFTTIDGKKYGLIDEKGNWLIEPRWYSAPDGAWIADIAYARLTPKEYGYIDINDPDFKVIIPAQFSSVSSFSDGMAAVRKGNAMGHHRQRRRMDSPTTIRPKTHNRRRRAPALRPVERQMAYYALLIFLGVPRALKRDAGRAVHSGRTRAPLHFHPSRNATRRAKGAAGARGRFRFIFVYLRIKSYHSVS